MKRFKYVIYLSIILLSTLILCPTVQAGTFMDGTIIVKWIDYGDVRNERPDSIDLVLTDVLSTGLKHQTVTLNKADATSISVDPNDSAITEWKFTKDGYHDYFFIHDSWDECSYQYAYVEDLSALGYNDIFSMITGDLHPTKFSFTGSVLEGPGTLVVTLIKDTLTTKRLTVTYNDTEARDDYGIRNLDFAIKGANVADPVTQNAYYNFKIKPSDTIKGDSIDDVYTTSIYISGTDAYQPGNPIIDYVIEEDNTIADGRAVTYKIDGDDIFVTVSYLAKTRVVPIKVVWQDKDDKMGLRPSDLSLKIYDQNGNLEKDTVLSHKDGWATDETLYVNMRYSGGTPIDYVMELEADDDYVYTASKDGDGYKIIAKLKNIDLEDEDTTDDGEVEVSEVENPETGNCVTKYILMLILSLTGMIITLKFEKKREAN